jgi:RNA polymerase sigma-70 factor (ECF subfamily)
VNADNFLEEDDAGLVAAIARRDDSAFVEALERNRAPVHAFARRLVADEGRAEEIAQEVFLGLWERPDRFDASRGSLRSFLLAKTHSRAIDVIRADSSRRRREERDARWTSGRGQDVEHEVVGASVAGEVRRALDRLPVAERELIELAYFGGHSYRDVAVRLDLPEGTVKARIRKGLSKLRRELTNRGLREP